MFKTSGFVISKSINFKILGTFQCRYCKGKSAEDVINAQNNKLHYLYSVNKEVEEIRNVSDKRSYFLKRINQAITNYQKLTAVYKRDDYKHLLVWKEVFEKIK